MSLKARLLSLILFFSFFMFHPHAVSAGETILTASDGASSDFFGESVALDGPVAVVGAPHDLLFCIPENPCPVPRGKAYIFGFDGSAWVQQQIITASGAEHFGTSVSVSGDSVVAGGRGDGAYFFRKTPSVWVEEARVFPPGGGTGITGIAVAVDGDAAVLGGTGTHIYRFDGVSWGLEATLESEGAGINGNAVAIEGNTALVVTWGGFGHIYRFDGLSWNEEALLVPPEGNFGVGPSVTLNGDTAFVGARDWGAVYVYRHDGVSWNEDARIPAEGSIPVLGASLSAFGDRLIAGAIGFSFSTRGSAYIFQFDGSLWNETARLFPAAGGVGDRTGTSVASNGEEFFVGSPGIDVAASNSGSVSVFVVSPNPPVASAVGPSALGEGEGGILDGSGSFDPDGEPLSYSWSQPAGAVISDRTAAMTSFIAPQVDQDTVLTFRLTVSDGVFHDSVTVDVSIANVFGPDLFFSQLESAKTTVRAGSRLRVHDTIQNGGQEPAGPSSVSFRLLSSPPGDVGVIPLSPDRVVEALSPGAESQGTSRLDIPETVVPGGYFLCATADSENAVLETGEGNNDLCFPVLVTPGKVKKPK